jgi:hypothetical protein
LIKFIVSTADVNVRNADEKNDGILNRNDSIRYPELVEKPHFSQIP